MLSFARHLVSRQGCIAGAGLDFISRAFPNHEPLSFVEFHFVGIRPQDERAARHEAKDIFVVEVFFHPRAGFYLNEVIHQVLVKAPSNLAPRDTSVRQRRNFKIAKGNDAAAQVRLCFGVFDPLDVLREGIFKFRCFRVIGSY